VKESNLRIVSFCSPASAGLFICGPFSIVVNFLKFPLHIFIWKTIDLHSLSLNLILLPAIAIGAFTGIQLIKKISDAFYRTDVIIITVLSAFLLLIL